MLANSSARPMRPSGTARPACAMKSSSETLAPSRLVAPHDLVADDDPDMQRIGQHVVFGALLRQHLGKGELRCAADRGRRAVGPGRLRADIEHGDDAAPAALLHLREDQAAKADLSEQLQVEIGLPHLVGDRFRRAARRLPGIVDKDVDLAEGRHRLVIGAPDVGGLGDVAADRDHLAARRAGLDLRFRLGERALVARQDRDIGARGRVFLRNREAQPLAAAGYDRASAVQPDFHDQSPHSMGPPHRHSRVIPGSSPGRNPGINLVAYPGPEPSRG